MVLTRLPSPQGLIVFTGKLFLFEDNWVECFFRVFETEERLFEQGDDVAIGVSGEKLKILSYHELYIEDRQRHLYHKRENNCTFCGVFHRQALDRAATTLGVNHIVTVHNVDDIAEMVIMNNIRGHDVASLGRRTAICTQGEDTIRYPSLSSTRMKGDRRFSTEWINSPDVHRGDTCAFLKRSRGGAAHSGERFEVKDEKAQQTCTRCGYISSNYLCKACSLMSTTVITDRGRRKLTFEAQCQYLATCIPYFHPPNSTIITKDSPKQPRDQ
ncbi:mitochondrial protein [Lactarius sanguifluus]|nr:mitochondrial protein [Lactarius sanguifluus]